MRTTRLEQKRAEQVSAAIDRWLAEPESGMPGASLTLAAEEAGLAPTIRDLARLPSLLGPVDPALEQQVLRRVRTAVPPVRRRARWRPAWAVAGLAAVLVLAMLLTPWGHTAVAGFMAVFQLGRTEVRITPVDSPTLPLATSVAGQGAVSQSLSLAEAQARVDFAIPQPAYLPPGYELQSVSSYTYPDLPSWVPQPLFWELTYGTAAGRECALRLYPIMLGDQATISGLNLEASPIHDVRDVEVSGQPGVLLRLGEERAQAAWQEVVWEQGDLILALSSGHLTEEELLRVARSIR